MILHQSVKDLVLDVKDLNERCEGLESENAELKATMRLVERSAKAVGARPTSNLTSYAESDGSSEGTYLLQSSLGRCSANAPVIKDGNAPLATKAELAAMKENLDDTRDAVKQILEKFGSQISEIRTQSKSDVESVRLNLTKVKGRVGAAEKDIKSLENEMGDMSVSKQDNDDYFFRGPAKSSGELQNYFTDELEKLQNRLNKDSVGFKALQDRVREQGRSIEGIQSAVEAQGTAVEDLMVAKPAETTALKPESFNWNSSPSPARARAHTPTAAPAPVLTAEVTHDIAFYLVSLVINLDVIRH